MTSSALMIRPSRAYQAGVAMKRLMLSVVIGSALVAASSASAQTNASPWTQSQLRALANTNSVANYSFDRIRGNVINRSVPNFAFSSRNYNSMFSSSLTGARQGGKPFSALGSQAAVTPYLSLSEPFSSSAHNYYTQVRPQLDQQRAQQMAMRNRQMQQTSITATPPYDPQGSAAMAPTGHAAVYMNYAGYYPPVNIPRTR
jgi:hypothetical protein